MADNQQMPDISDYIPYMEDIVEDTVNRRNKEIENRARAAVAAKTLEKEALDRARDDKKYFWLGALVSLVTSLLVTYGSKLILALQQLFL